MGFLISLIEPALSGVWPVTVTGWITGISTFAILAFLLYDKVAGKSKAVQRMETQIDALQSEAEDLNATQLVLSNNLKSLAETITKLTYQMQGVDGQNGARGDIREIRAEMAEMQARNRKIDILAAQIEPLVKYEGPERREHLRRLEQGRRIEDNL